MSRTLALVVAALAFIASASAFAPVPAAARPSTALEAYGKAKKVQGYMPADSVFNTPAEYNNFLRKEQSKKTASANKVKSKWGKYEDIGTYIQARDAKLGDGKGKDVTAWGHRFVKFKVHYGDTHHCRSPRGSRPASHTLLFLPQGTPEGKKYPWE